MASLINDMLVMIRRGNRPKTRSMFNVKEIAKIFFLEFLFSEFLAKKRNGQINRSILALLGWFVMQSEKFTV